VHVGLGWTTKATVHVVVHPAESVTVAVNVAPFTACAAGTVAVNPLAVNPPGPLHVMVVYTPEPPLGVTVRVAGFPAQIGGADAVQVGLGGTTKVTWHVVVHPAESLTVAVKVAPFTACAAGTVAVNPLAVNPPGPLQVIVV